LEQYLESFQRGELLRPLRTLQDPISRLAFLNALCVTGYSIFNKIALTMGLDPIVLYAPTNLVGALVLIPFARHLLSSTLPESWRAAKRDMFSIGGLQTGGYLLVLWAMSRAPVGYV